MFSKTGSFGFYFNTGTVATSGTLTIIGSGNVTLQIDSHNTGGTCQYQINAGGWISISSGTPFTIFSGQTLTVRVNAMNTSGDAQISFYSPSGTLLDTYSVTKL